MFILYCNYHVTFVIIADDVSDILCRLSMIALHSKLVFSTDGESNIFLHAADLQSGPVTQRWPKSYTQITRQHTTMYLIRLDPNYLLVYWPAKGHPYSVHRLSITALRFRPSTHHWHLQLPFAVFYSSEYRLIGKWAPSSHIWWQNTGGSSGTRYTDVLAEGFGTLCSCLLPSCVLGHLAPPWVRRNNYP